MDDLRIGSVSLDVAAPPTEGVDAETHRNDLTEVPTIFVEDMSPDSKPVVEEKGPTNKIFIYLDGNKQNKGFVHNGLGASDPHVTEQLAEQVAAEVKKPKFLNDEQKAQLKKIVVQRYSAENASVHFLASNKRLLSARNIALTISNSEDGEVKAKASSVDAHE